MKMLVTSRKHHKLRKQTENNITEGKTKRAVPV